MFRKEPVGWEVTGKLHEEFSAEKNGKLKINNGLWIEKI